MGALCGSLGAWPWFLRFPGWCSSGAKPGLHPQPQLGQSVSVSILVALSPREVILEHGGGGPPREGQRRTPGEGGWACGCSSGQGPGFPSGPGLRAWAAGCWPRQTRVGACGRPGPGRPAALREPRPCRHAERRAQHGGAHGGRGRAEPPLRAHAAAGLLVRALPARPAPVGGRRGRHPAAGPGGRAPGRRAGEPPPPVWPWAGQFTSLSPCPLGGGVAPVPFHSWSLSLGATAPSEHWAMAGDIWRSRWGCSWH